MEILNISVNEWRNNYFMFAGFLSKKIWSSYFLSHFLLYFPFGYAPNCLITFCSYSMHETSDCGKETF